MSTAGRRLDLQLPGWLPLAELVPGLVLGLGLVPGDWRLTTSGGRALEPGSDLLGQGVEDGALLALVPAAPAPVVHDDPAQAVAEAVEAVAATSGPTVAGSHVTTGAFVGLLAIALAGLAGASRPVLAGAAAGLAGLLLLGVAVLDRVPRLWDRPIPTALLALAASSYVAVSGYLLASGVPVAGVGGKGLALVASGAALAAAGGCVLARCGGQAVLGLFVTLAGAALTALGLLRALLPFDVASVLAVLLVVAVVGDAALPWLLAPRPDRAADPAAAPDAAALREQVGRGQRGLLVGCLLAGLAIVGSAPWVAGRGWSGAALSAAAAMVVLLRARQHRAPPIRVAGTLAGLLGLGVALASTLWTQPVARLPVAVASIGLAILVPAVPRWVTPARREQLLEVVHATALVSLAPLAVVGTGVLHRIGW